MELVNELYAHETELTAPVVAEVIEKLTLLLGPFAPFAAEEMWELLGRTGPVFRQPWPKYNSELEKEDAAEVILQVNGKLRGRLTVPFGLEAAYRDSYDWFVREGRDQYEFDFGADSAYL